MKKLLLLGAFLAAASLGLQEASTGHGGTYRGPGDTVPPGGGGGGGGGGPTTPGPSGPSGPGPAGPSTPAPGSPGAPAGGAGGGAAPTTGAAASTGPDLEVWSFWWEFNKDPYLNLKASIHSGGVVTGSGDFFLGQGEKTQAKDSLRPSEEQIRQKVVPALIKSLNSETNNDIVTGCLIALAKIGDAKSEAGESEFEKQIAKKLTDSNQEIAETAAVALGILANPKSVDTLEHILRDDADGRKLVGKSEVPYRTRAFAAYGLGLIASRNSDNEVRRRVNAILIDTLQEPRMSTRDVKVAALIAIGLAPIDPSAEAPAPEGEEELTVTEKATQSRQTQLAFVRDYFKNEDNHYLIRAHAPRTMARLLEGAPDESRKEIAELLVAGIGKHTKERQEVRQSCALALGQVGDADEDKIDKDIREALIQFISDGQNQERYFSLISLAQIAGRPGTGADPFAGVSAKKDGIRSELLSQLAKGKSRLRPWAALACGVMGRALIDADQTDLPSSGEALRMELRDQKSPEDIGAYAIAVGIRKDLEARDILLQKLQDFSQDEARGYIAVALGLMEAREAIEPLQEIVKKSKYRPDLLKQAAIALGLLGDKELVPDLITMLEEAKGLASQAAISSALGFIGDSRSIDPLVAMLQNDDITDRARGFAAVALGIVADKEPLPWNSKIALDINYRANTTTLTSAAEGTGILDIL